MSDQPITLEGIRRLAFQKTHRIFAYKECICNDCKVIIDSMYEIQPGY